uniref:F-box and WD repeat domain containing 12 n=1 Tax=Spermophilus dauricus TaxID=99837 RepID=A0A8C9QNS4_SPEDA
IWSSPLQPAPLVNLVTYPQLQLVATVDQQGLIKVWKAETGWEWASFCLPTSCSAVEACDHPEGSFLLVACAEGTLYTLTVPQLQVVSKVTLFPSPFVCLLCSPDRQWLFASAHNSDLGPKVFYTRSLLHPSEDELPVSTTLTVRLSSKACWAPDEAARLTVMHRNGSVRQLVVTTFELKAMKSRDRVSILGKSPPCWPRSAHHQHHSVVFLGRVSVSLLNTCSSLPGPPESQVIGMGHCAQLEQFLRIGSCCFMT